MYQRYFKRGVDLSIALPAILALSPIICFIAFLLFFVNKGQVFYLQERPGLNEHPFIIWKFKTMRDAYDSEGKLLPDSDRMTKIGKWIRSYSLDEILQLINVIKGDMSLIGPRPLLMKYLPRYNSIQRKRHLLRPGITGWAQVNGRNALTWEKKFELDVYYVEHLSFGLDIKILILTIGKVFLRENINQSSQSTMEEFLGSDATSTS